jgi:ketosteroid isomerase-like protein
MSQENVEIVRRCIDAWSRRDVDGALRLIHENIEWRPAFTAGGLEGTAYRGPAGIRSWFSELDEVWAELSLEPNDVRDLDEGQVLLLAHFHAVGRKSGVAIDQPVGFVFTIEGGKLAAGRGFRTHQEALEAATSEGPDCC